MTGVKFRGAGAALAMIFLAGCSAVTAVPHSNDDARHDLVSGVPHSAPLANVALTVAWGTGGGSVSLSTAALTPVVVNAPVSQTTIQAPVGNPIVKIVTWTGKGGTGTELGEVDRPMVVSATEANALNLAGSGDATSMTVYTPPDESPDLLLGTPATGYTMVWYDAKLGVYYENSTGQTLLLAPPTLTTNLLPNVLRAGYSDGSRREIALNAQYDIQAVPLTLGAVNADASTVSAASIPFKRVWPTVVINARQPFVQMFDRDGNALPLLPGAFSGLTKPTAILWDQCHPQYMIADGATNTMHFYELDGSTSPYHNVAYPGMKDPVGLFYDGPAGVGVVNAGTNSINFYGDGKVRREIVTDFPLSQASASQATLGETFVLSTKRAAVRTYEGAEQTSRSNAFRGLIRPVNLLIGDKQLYVVDQGSNSINVFKFTGERASSGQGFPGLTKPNFMAYAGPGFLVSSEADNSIKGFNYHGLAVPLPGGFTGLHGPIGMTEAGPGC